MLPPFDEAGDLPPGIYPVSLGEMADRFRGSTPQRQSVTRRLERIFTLAVGTQKLSSFVVFGSYVSSKAAPNDVDVFLVMKDEFDVTQIVGEAGLLFDHAAADAHFGASIFWIRELAALGGIRSAMEDWQLKRDGSRRGIVEIVPEVAS